MLETPVPIPNTEVKLHTLLASSARTGAKPSSRLLYTQMNLENSIKKFKVNLGNSREYLTCSYIVAKAMINEGLIEPVKEIIRDYEKRKYKKY